MIHSTNKQLSLRNSYSVFVDSNPLSFMIASTSSKDSG